MSQQDTTSFETATGVGDEDTANGNIREKCKEVTEALIHDFKIVNMLNSYLTS